jgi:dihydroorotate dehydrogenase
MGYTLLKPLLFALDAERAHNVALASLKLANAFGLAGLMGNARPPMPLESFGLKFPNPVGLAAGLDKNGECIDALGKLGFGFVEVGTATPKPQAGNPKPRLFRVSDRAAIVNRMGFNNHGIDALVRNVERSRFLARGGIVGVNIGKNKDTPNEKALDDYRYCLERAYAAASYVTVNVSSPNTPELRNLQYGEALKQLVGGLRETQERLAAQHGKRTPILLKIAPDISEAETEALAHTLNELRIDGVLATNTTTDHVELAGTRYANEVGGVSGAPLYGRSTLVLRRLRVHLHPDIPIIGVGGISSGADAVAKVAAGARLVQLYTGLIYRGPALIGECIDALRRRKEAPASKPPIE